MTEFPYTLTPVRLKEFLDRIPADGVPAKLTVKVMEARGFKSSNDRAVLRVVKAIGLIDDGGTPTDNWRLYRNRSTNRSLLAKLLHNTYEELFATYPDAQSRSDEEIVNFVQANSSVGERAVHAIVSTFKTLCSLADFANPPSADSSHDASDSSDEEIHDDNPLPSNIIEPRSIIQKSAQKNVSTAAQLSDASINLSVHIHLSDIDNRDTIDFIFQSMARHLLRGNESQKSGEKETENVSDIP